jgi:hypothetical protein
LDPVWYLQAYPEVRAEGIDPLQHYVSFGKKEGRQKRAAETDLGKVSWQALKRACGFQGKVKAEYFLTKTEGPWWILNVELQRPAGYYGWHRLRLRCGEREAYLEKPGTDSKGAVRFRHLLKLPSAYPNIRVVWVEEGWGSQRCREISQINLSKFSASSIYGQTDMTIMPKTGFFRSAEKKIRKWRKGLLLRKQITDCLCERKEEFLAIQSSIPLEGLSPFAKKIYHQLLRQKKVKK